MSTFAPIAYNDITKQFCQRRRYRVKINEVISKKGAEGYFAAANSRYGFYSLYDEVYSERELNRVYIIKGGPGTGKSTLMSKIAERASELGLKTDVYLCSSDPGSLDGVIVKELGVAVLDGTAPHARDPVYPGVCGETVDLGRFWDSDRLAAAKTEITSLISSKSDAYSRAYRYLSAAGTAHEDLMRGIARIFDRTKAERAVCRLFDKLKIAEKSDAPTVKHRFLGAISTSGTGTLDTLERKAETVYAVSELYGAETLFLDLVRKEGEKRGVSMTVIPDPLSPDCTDAVYFDGMDIFITSSAVSRADAHPINMKRFAAKDALASVRGKLRMSERMKNALIDEAVRSLTEAGAAHASTESIYSSSMDFDAVAEQTETLLGRIFR